ncbi:MAG: hypothetical protein BGO34_10705 [Bacteroidia bacterium 44-10]|nr:MAG: hypothetical protein BGO34_10705 [Bacteroidia bacterium 44-10]
MKRYPGIIVFSVLIFSGLSCAAQNMRYGLEFNSYDLVQEKRTSLNLSPSKVFSFPNGFSLSFNIHFQPDPKYNFGYIFRIIGENTQHLDFLVSPEKLTVVISDDNVLVECSLSETSNDFSSFIAFQTDFDIKNELLNIVINEKTFSQKVSFLEDFKKTKIIFGRCDHPLFQTSDVPKMVVKDIRINSLKGDVIYYWKLSKHAENGVHDELVKYFAKVENPIWLINEHAFWKKKISFTTLKNPQIAFNPDEGTIAVADKRSFFTYNTTTSKLAQDENLSGFVHSDRSNQIIYNPSDSNYYSYCFMNTEGRDVARYDFLNKSWSNTEFREFGDLYWHHNRFISSRENCLYMFGGYGQHKYNNQAKKYSFITGKWEELHFNGEQIYPRYLSGLGAIDDERILLFGGYGNRSGLQSLSPRNFYDLYQVTLPDLTVKKIWEMPPPHIPFVVGNSLIVDTLNRCFYALCFPQNQYETSISLAKFSIQKPEYEMVADDIPFYFNDVLSYADLFQDKKTNNFYAVTSSSFPSDSLSTVTIYSLAYPAVARSYVYHPVNTSSHFKHDLLYGVIFVLLLTSPILFFFFRFSRMKNREPQVEQSPELSNEVFNEVKQQVSARPNKQALFLFGGFQVKDKSGNDITGEFSPMLKQLFLIILLHTFKEDSIGISSNELDETLWPNKTPESARNNRAVMISRIRRLLETIGHLNIENSNSYWVMKLGEDVICDYCEALSLINRLKDKNNRTKKDVMRLLSILSFGGLLPDIQAEWIDYFKADFANDLIDLLIDISRQKEFVFSSSELVSLADILLIYDELNEEALKLKCCALVKMGRNGLAKATYNSFVKQYSVLLGIKYNYYFDQIILQSG